MPTEASSTYTLNYIDGGEKRIEQKIVGDKVKQEVPVVETMKESQAVNKDVEGNEKSSDFEKVELTTEDMVAIHNFFMKKRKLQGFPEIKPHSKLQVFANEHALQIAEHGLSEHRWLFSSSDTLSFFSGLQKLGMPYSVYSRTTEAIAHFKYIGQSPVELIQQAIGARENSTLGHKDTVYSSSRYYGFGLIMDKKKEEIKVVLLILK